MRLAFDDLRGHRWRPMANRNTQLAVIVIRPDAAILASQVRSKQRCRSKPEGLQRLLRDLGRHTLLTGVELRDARRLNENRGMLSLRKDGRMVDECHERDVSRCGRYLRLRRDQRDILALGLFDKKLHADHAVEPDDAMECMYQRCRVVLARPEQKFRNLFAAFYRLGREQREVQVFDF